MNFIKYNLANAFTLANLFSGSIGVIHLITGNYRITAFCIILSLILDFFDGFVARAMKSNSELGTQLDSLADMVSFGLIPGLALFKALEPFGNQLFSLELPFEIKYIGLFVTLFSCLRLAIFNLDEEQTYYFKGLNTPANTILIFGMYYSFMETEFFKVLFENPVLLILVTIISSWLLVSPIKMISLKFKSMTISDNYPKIILAVGVILLVILLKTVGIPLAILYYILVSLIFQKHLSK
ncbi:CDP-alcohol phosphatidyltransferase [Chryseobacterium sp. SNU WT5]|uniref:CDP-alcohol phosphatidyltransferase family protein n=1 Tax=Chryseobacterium sp. SNU WT5 TaxID=2594269 RepID=UPI00117FA181|nr:CDP-alcohol phosphatidyltransferase family protein [Chryseobacterium sp. SNU WT5]QDP84401.1 CDP-alcohol phosphatidyltransferase [Chryseobacterium sp. SNU WT5]